MKVIDFSQTNSILNQYISEIRNVEVQNDRLRFRRNIERIGDNQRFVVNTRRCDIFYMYIKFQGIFIFSIGGHKCIFCSVEIA